jgi:hypothetical protein
VNSITEYYHPGHTEKKQPVNSVPKYYHPGHTPALTLDVAGATPDPGQTGTTAERMAAAEEPAEAAEAAAAMEDREEDATDTSSPAAVLPHTSSQT